MEKTKKRKKKGNSAKATALLICLVLLTGAVAVLFMLDAGAETGVREVETTTFGVDVARYQGTVDWAEVAENGVDFAMVRLGYRGLVTGEIVEDSNARYNLQEASRHGIKLGAYFFSTAVNEQEAKEEAAWVAEILAGYPITYPVAYNCEGFLDPENRHAHLSVAERTDVALAFLKAVEKHGYEAMFYASKNEMEADALWQVSRIQDDYKVWVAQYPEKPYPETERTDYSGVHRMWQYSREGSVAGISGPVDLDIAYFGYDGIALPKNPVTPETVGPDVEAMMEFTPLWEHVTAKEETNLRDIPSQDDSSRILHKLKNGEVTMRTGISESGWSRLVYEGVTCYAVSSYLTTDLLPPETEGDDGIQTEFRKADDWVTAKDAVNLRTIPSVTDPESRVVVKLEHGEAVQRTGINEDVGWSRVVWNGQTLYCITSYLETVTEQEKP